MSDSLAMEDLRKVRPLLEEKVQRVLETARRLGATAAEVVVSEADGLAVSVRQGELETVESSRDQGFGITVYLGQRKGAASTSDPSPQAVEQTVAKALNIARFTAEDPAAGLADAALMARPPLPELDLYHPWELSVDQAAEMARVCEAAALGVDRRIGNSEGATVSTSQGCRAYGNSHGLIASECGTRHGMSVSVIAGSGDAMQRDHDYTLDRRADRLADPVTVGEEAGRRALARLGARSVPTGRVPVLFDHEVAGGLIGHFLAAISGGALYRRASFLLDALDTQLFPERMRIHEQPHLPAALGSAAFDGDGVATRAKDIVADGVLRSYLLSAYSARRLGMETTGNAGGVHNLRVSSDGLSRAELLREMGTGLLVTELMGQGVNGVTGDYSRGAAGFWVENGELAFPVHEVTVAGNLKAMFAAIRAIGDDVRRPANVSCGSLLIDGMTLSGQ